MRNNRTCLLYNETSKAVANQDKRSALLHRISEI